MCNYSEFEMANSFEANLNKNRVPRLPSFDCLFREALCQQGIADFVGLNFNEKIDIYKFDNIYSIENYIKILSLLKKKSGRTFKYLQKQTSLSENMLLRILKEMISNKYIKVENNLYYRYVSDVSKQVNVWAFELKLANWKRALFQALQYKSISNYSIVVFPFNKQNVLNNNLHYFKELNVGVLLFDLESEQFKWLYYPKKEHPISKWNSFFTLGKLFQSSSEECVIVKQDK